MRKVNETVETAEIDFLSCSRRVWVLQPRWKEQVHGRHRTVSLTAIFVTSHLARIAVDASEFLLPS